ncbi:MAG: short-chain dehydrogenase [Deltaproteobacteria bacterium HGW-Deltaproteobacteria-14]|nr:MAG: short-chain dehydrogenase [Deltaproteobacteria bacterium HGW-Deltaproteobacteria-14]
MRMKHTGVGGFRDRYGPWALIAGASEGLGEAFARQAAARGLDVVLVARRGEVLARVAGEIAVAHGVRTRVVVADLAEAGCAARIGAAVADLEVGLLVHNAALSVPGPFLDTPAEAHASAVAVNCASQVALVHAFAGPMRARGRGGVVIVSSLSGFYGSGDLATYAATKAFGATLAEGLWFELGPAGVDVVATCAGATLTPGYARRAPEDLPRLAPAPMAPDAVADDALRALGRGPRTIPGRGNRLASFILRAFVPRRRAIGMMSAAGRAVFEAERRADDAV